MARQLSFDLPALVVLGRADFYVAPSNALAVAMIESTETWPAPQLTVCGPEGAGKTHLANVWANMTGAVIVPSRDLPGRDIPTLAETPVAVEDVPEIAANAAAMDALFHLFNLMRAHGRPLLMTGRGDPSQWGLALPDIQSRVQAAAHVALDLPDDTLLAAVLGKLFADRQITPKPDVIPYLVRHMERSFAAAQSIVAGMDKMALDEGRTVSRQVAARMIAIAAGSSETL